MEALTKVIDDAADQGCEEIVCLGDLVGYGPQPRQVMKMAQNLFRFCIMGNHEEAVLYEPVGFNWKAEVSAHWTREQLRSRRYPKKETESIWEFLENLPRFVEEGDTLYVHASPLDPTKEYVMPEACFNPEIMKSIFRRIRRIAFGGHTHLPGIFVPGKNFLPQDEIDEPVPVENGKFFVNTGSVGQPRDGDSRSCYVIYDGRTVEFRRVRYNHKKTLNKIKRIKRIPNALGHRLALGL
jgi:diadenosine tetraphosphatase ApaH/serine/threonine PP2A family protein phosphatase